MPGLFTSTEGFGTSQGHRNKAKAHGKQQQQQFLLLPNLRAGTPPRSKLTRDLSQAPNDLCRTEPNISGHPSRAIPLLP